VLADWHMARPEDVQRAVRAAAEAHREWSNWGWEDRAAVFLRAAELLATTWRATLNAATMLGQSKTAYQAEIDSACELVDFLRFNVHFAQEIYAEQPLSDRTMWNQMDYRALEGFVYAVTPFNFTAIAGNLPVSAALMGNTVIWKPAASAMLSAYYIMKLLEEAGSRRGDQLPPRRPGADLRRAARPPRPRRACTSPAPPASSTRCGDDREEHGPLPLVPAHRGRDRRQGLHRRARERRAPGARGGDRARRLRVPGAEVLGASRVYVPRSLWPEVRDRTAAIMREMPDGRPHRLPQLPRRVIDAKAHTTASRATSRTPQEHATILAGGTADDSTGYFVQPTLVETSDPGTGCCARRCSAPCCRARVRRRALGGDAARGRPDRRPYALTGAVFARDRKAVKQAMVALRNAAGNFYVNDKPTGAVVGQQPFRRRARLGHERQGGLEAEPRALDEPARGEGDLRLAHERRVSVHGRGVAAGLPLYSLRARSTVRRGARVKRGADRGAGGVPAPAISPALALHCAPAHASRPRSRPPRSSVADDVDPRHAARRRARRRGVPPLARATLPWCSAHRTRRTSCSTTGGRRGRPSAPTRRSPGPSSRGSSGGAIWPGSRRTCAGCAPRG
jgi:1-pyrroline-5-carboxylate dehydrogenase